MKIPVCAITPPRNNVNISTGSLASPSFWGFWGATLTVSGQFNGI